jgi:hypothetical protein
MTAKPTCLALDKQVVCLAFSRAWLNTGNRMAARIAMIAITHQQLNEGEALPTSDAEITNHPTSLLSGVFSSPAQRWRFFA